MRWADASKKIKTGDDLTQQTLFAFRTWLGGLPNRSLASANRDLASISALLNRGRTAGLYPRLNRDAIADGLKRYKYKPERKDFLRPDRCIQLIDAALAHDAQHT